MDENKKDTKTSRGKKEMGAPAPSGAMTRSSAMMASAGGIAPVGMLSDSLALEADVSGEFADLSPTFGDTLLAIGTGVSDSQAALDNSLVETARNLSATKIDVVTDVVQELNEDGLPDLAKSELVTQQVSLINYLNPTVHEWKRVALSMDLSVGAMDTETGFTFSRKQHKGGANAAGLFWGFLGWFSTYESEKRSSRSGSTDRESDWANGQVRLDAELGPRQTEKFSAPASVTIGPSLYFSQGSVTETMTDGAVSARSIDLIIKARKANGSANPSVPIELDADRFRYSFVSGDGYDGSTTNAQGEVKVTLTRDIPNARFLRQGKAVISAKLGQIEKNTTITL